MTVYDRPIATALRLIEKYGVECEWRKSEVVSADPDKPWEGGSQVPDTFNPFICFLPATSGASDFGLSKFRTGTEQEGFSTFGLMGAQEFNPEITDRLTRDGNVLVLKAIDTLNPADQVVLYILSIV